MNPLYLLFLLLPVAAFSGWWIARRSSARTSGERVNALSQCGQLLFDTGRARVTHGDQVESRQHDDERELLHAPLRKIEGAADN